MTSQLRYWSRRRLAVTVKGPEGSFSVTTDKPFARIGSDEGAEVVLRDERLPRRGLYLHATDDGVFWVKLAVRETAEEPPHGWVTSDKPIRFGPYRISARLADEGALSPGFPPDLCAKGGVPEPHPFLAIAFGDREVAHRRLTRRLTLVGRCRPSALRISSNDLSAPHLVLYWEAGTLWAVDLLSRTGTRLEGMPIQAGEFPQGTSLTLGEVVVTYAQRANNRPVPPMELPLTGEAGALASEAAPEEGQEPSLIARPGEADQTVAQRPFELQEQARREAEWKRRQDELQGERRQWEDFRRQAEEQLAAQRQRLDAQQAELQEGQQTLQAEWQRLTLERLHLENERAATSSQHFSTAEELQQRSACLERREAELEGRWAAFNALQAEVRSREDACGSEWQRREAALVARQEARHRACESAWQERVAGLAREQAEQEADLKRGHEQLESQRAEHQAQQEAWDAARKGQEADLRRLASQLDEERDKLAAIRQDLERERREWEDFRCHAKQQLTDERQRIDVQQASAVEELQQRSARLERREAELEGRRAAFESLQAEARSREEAGRSEWQRRQAKLVEQEAALAARQEAWQKARESEWQERLAGLAREQAEQEADLKRRHEELAAQRQQVEAQQAAVGQDQQRLQAEWQQWEAKRADLEHHRASALARDRATLDARRREREEQQAQLESARQSLNMERAELQGARNAIPAECEAARSRFQEEQTPPGQSATRPEAAKDDVASGAQASPTDDDSGYDETLDRLCQYSRARSGWWYRLRCAISGRSKDPRAFQSRNSDDVADESEPPG